MWLEILAVRVRMGEDDGVGLRVFLLSRAVTLGDFGGTARPTWSLSRNGEAKGYSYRFRRHLETGIPGTRGRVEVFFLSTITVKTTQERSI